MLLSWNIERQRPGSPSGHNAPCAVGTAFVFREACILTQASEDVFNIDVGVVNQHANGDRESAKGHAIHSERKGVQAKKRSH